MNKENLLSRAEMKKVMGGTRQSATGCLQECELEDVGKQCGGDKGVCTFYAASDGCPGGERLCVK
ncbi:hypothetical protein [Pedobacter sp. SL55]|uniref:hypothetical protein n=1 Tax=Pedobacter sp. SL55 TaxID=2995161 RepID=UPI00226E8D62|nr:hypothetical protein [Pedobacter sp. SL55]WAC41401.1 hypothetical protein OVA16_03280 [Pedobacter sp. SL55]